MLGAELTAPKAEAARHTPCHLLRGKKSPAVFRDQETFSTNSEFADKLSFRRTKMIGSIWQNLGENAQSAEMADDSGIFKTASFQEHLHFSLTFLLEIACIYAVGRKWDDCALRTTENLFKI